MLLEALAGVLAFAAVAALIALIVFVVALKRGFGEASATVGPHAPRRRRIIPPPIDSPIRAMAAHFSAVITGPAWMS